MTPTGNLFIIAAPSGTGKTSLVNALVEAIPDIMVSISHTTRQKRPAETEGINYYFISENQFHSMREQGEFLEHAVVFNQYYGTSHQWVEDTLAKGIDVILEIDWQGSQQIQRLFPDCISIFILPPSLSDLEDRLKKRNQDKPHIIHERLLNAEETLHHIHEFTYLVLNADFEHALADLKTIVLAQRLLQKNQRIRFSKLLDSITKLEEKNTGEK
jgi:guanylate kinase